MSAVAGLLFLTALVVGLGTLIELLFLGFEFVLGFFYSKLDK